MLVERHAASQLLRAFGPLTSFCIMLLAVFFLANIPNTVVVKAAGTSRIYLPMIRTTTTASTSPEPTITAAEKHGWGPVVAGDEFSYTGAPDKTKWVVYNSAGHNGKGVRSPAAWNVANGAATVTGNPDGTTGGMAAKFARRTYGRWEARIKTNARDPKYSAVLLLWPEAGQGTTCPEIDYMESTSNTTRTNFYLHYGCEPKQTYARQTIDQTQWHTYAVEWTPDHVYGYIDGVKWFSDTTKEHIPTGVMFQTIQLDWFPDGTPTKTSTMTIDWIRVYNP